MDYKELTLKTIHGDIFTFYLHIFPFEMLFYKIEFISVEDNWTISGTREIVEGFDELWDIEVILNNSTFTNKAVIEDLTGPLNAELHKLSEYMLEAHDENLVEIIHRLFEESLMDNEDVVIQLPDLDPYDEYNTLNSVDLREYNENRN